MGRFELPPQSPRGIKPSFLAILHNLIFRAADAIRALSPLRDFTTGAPSLSSTGFGASFIPSNLKSQIPARGHPSAHSQPCPGEAPALPGSPGDPFSLQPSPNDSKSRPKVSPEQGRCLSWPLSPAGLISPDFGPSLRKI